MVKGALEKHLKAEVQPVRYGFFDTFRFIMPFGTRDAPVRRVIRELRDARAEYPDAHISVIAHSFGTYALNKALKELDIKLHRIILCGCIIPEGFRRAEHKAQLGSDPILNDCGTRDIWPVLAKAVTWGYGATGTFGFGTRGVRDRFNNFLHGDYFNQDFVEQYWVPFLSDGSIIETKWEEKRPTTPYWLSLLSVMPIRWFLSLALCWLIYLSGADGLRRIWDAEVFIDRSKNIRYYSSHVVLSGTEEECRQTRCRISYHDTAFLSGPKGADLSYEGRAMTSGRIISMKTNPPHEIMNPNQWPDNPTVLMFRIPPASAGDRVLQIAGELQAEATFSAESGKVGPHFPYDTRYAVFLLDIRGLRFELKNLEAQIEVRRDDGKLVAGYSSPKLTILEDGKLILATASNLVAGSSLYVKWGKGKSPGAAHAVGDRR
ncbi:MAG: hypothetical protein AB7F78_14085 [Hyphomicrobiaceae bacterium]